MKKLVVKEKLDFIAFNHENEIDLIAREGRHLNDLAFLPNPAATSLCINKYKLNQFLNKNLPELNCVPKSYKLKSLDDINDALKHVETIPVWVRTNEGSSSVGAAPMYSEDEVKFWINYWVDHKNATVDNFTISEMLPGRDIHCFSLWNNGEMVIGKCVERLEYLNSKITLSGTYSSPSVSTMVNEPELLKRAQIIIKTIDKNARGLYGIDFKQANDGIFKLTEINIGRFPRINYIFNKVGTNMAALYIDLGLGHIDLGSGYFDKLENPNKKFYLFREVDTIPVLKSAEELNYGLEAL
jgi:carbamoyl-phosphate synthase large subunit